ncbi:MAG: hypothetical protein ACR2HF_16015 [Methylococcaceae bacterium]
MNLQAINEFLIEQGYRPNLEDDGDISFKSEGKYYVVGSTEGDETYVRLIAPNIWSLDSETERELAIQHANKLTSQFKVAKVFSVNDDKNIYATIELFLPDPQAFIRVFDRSMNVLNAAVREFSDEMRTAMEKVMEDTGADEE